LPGVCPPPPPPAPHHSVHIGWPRVRISPLRVGPGVGLRIAEAKHEDSEITEGVYVVYKFAKFLVLEVPGHTNPEHL
jgi:hypothetical protein